MISDKHKFIYIHIPKCGGMYITNHLVPFSEDLNTGVVGKNSDSIMVRRPCEKFHKDFGLRYMHASAFELRKYMGDNKYKEYFSFASIRNPWERMISVYFWGEGAPFNKAAFINNTAPHKNGFECYLDRIKKTFRRSVTPIDYFILNDDGEIIVDYVFEMKEMQKGLEHCKQELNISFDMDSRRHNVSSHNHYSLYYDDELKEMIHENYKWEIDYFNFKFEDKR